MACASVRDAHSRADCTVLAGAALSWHQTSEEVTLEACCPRDLRARDVVCSFTTHSLHVEARGTVIADGQLFAPIAPDDCWWEFGECRQLPPHRCLCDRLGITYTHSAVP